jgi:hypothetical protein
MFTVNGKYEVNFYYKDSERGKMTICEIVDTQASMPYIRGMGEAVCSPQDQFNKNTGRKIALLRALDDTGSTNKEVRKGFWDAYFAARNGKY